MFIVHVECVRMFEYYICRAYIYVLCITHRIDSTWSIYSDPITIHNSTLRVKSVFLVSILGDDVMCNEIHYTLHVYPGATYKK